VDRTAPESMPPVADISVSRETEPDASAPKAPSVEGAYFAELELDVAQAESLLSAMELKGIYYGMSRMRRGRDPEGKAIKESGQSAKS